MRHFIKLPPPMQIHVTFPLFRDATTRARIFLFFAGVDILNHDTHVHVLSFINRYSLTDLQWISRLNLSSPSMHLIGGKCVNLIGQNRSVSIG